MLQKRCGNHPVDIYETAEEVIVLVEIAGMNKKDITVTLDNNILKISGVRPDYSPGTKNRIHQMEIDYGKFERIMKIAIPIDTDNTIASYKEGFLKISIPKKREKQTVIVRYLTGGIICRRVFMKQSDHDTQSVRTT